MSTSQPHFSFGETLPSKSFQGLQQAEGDVRPPLNLRAGDVVIVKSAAEIFHTLDANGELEGMPFMPEMLKYCGQTLRVSKRAHKTCDPAQGIMGLRMESAVHLENLRCDGCFHDDCQADCLIFWKEAWLERADEMSGARTPALPARPPVCSEQTLLANTKVREEADGSPAIYKCQNTQVKHATRHVKWWDARQYIEDYKSGNVTLRQLVDGFAYTVWRTFTEAGLGIGKPMRWIYDRFQRARGGSTYPMKPFGVPDGEKTPKATLDLREGEFVRVRSHEEILSTLDSRYRNRGLYFDPDYVPFTGRVFKVKRRVQQIIDEGTGKMIRFKSDAIVLENVYCEGKYAFCRRFCPRAIVPYWREIWLERVSGREAERK